MQNSPLPTRSIILSQLDCLLHDKLGALTAMCILHEINHDSLWAINPDVFEDLKSKIEIRLCKDVSEQCYGHYYGPDK